MELALGDLVVAQRTDPGAGSRPPTDRFKSNMLIGLAAVARLIEWRDDTGDRQRDVCLLPLTKFDHIVPTTTAKSRHRLKRPSFSAPRELQDRQGQPAFGLSAVEWEDTSELLPYSWPWSRTSRTARSRSSSGYFPFFGIAPSFSQVGASTRRGAVHGTAFSHAKVELPIYRFANHGEEVRDRPSGLGRRPM